MFAAPLARSSTLRSTCGPTRRPSSDWFGVELDAENRLALYIPEGCAHGFLTLTDDAEVSYQISERYRRPSRPRRALRRSCVRHRVAGRGRR